MLDYPLSGSAVYATNLAAHLPREAPDLSFRLFVRNAHLPPEHGMNAQPVHTPLARFNTGRGVGARADKLFWETLSLPAASARRGQAVLHSLHFAAPVLSAAPVVVTIHDVIPLVLPGYHRSRQAALYSRFMSWASRRAAAVITVSQHSKRDIVRVLRLPEERVRVTYEAADERFAPAPVAGEACALRERYGLPERFLLYIGGAERRKNIETLVRAWAPISGRMRRNEVKLVVVATFPPPDALYPDVPGLARSLGIADDMVFVSRVAEQDKPALYRAAIGLLFPSRYEGFGFPPLEAMACGTPVAASNASSLPEVVGDGGLLLHPDDVAGWSDAMVALTESHPMREELRRRGLREARRFSWRETARQTADVYRSLLT